MHILISRRAIVSREAKKKHAYATTMSELFTRMAANAVTKSPEKISFRNYLPNTFYLGRIGKPKIV